MKKYTEQDFWTKVQKSNPEKCWLWLGCRTAKGYGLVTFQGMKTTAHRIAYLLVKGEIKKGLYVLHYCDNPPCCNPNHLWLGTQKQNIADMWNKGRAADMRREGEDHGMCKLTFAQCQEIKNLYECGNISQMALALEFNIGQTHVSRIIRGENRKNS